MWYKINIRSYIIDLKDKIGGFIMQIIEHPKKVIFGLICATISIIVFLFFGFILPYLPFIVKRIFVDIADTATMTSFIFGAIYIPYKLNGGQLVTKKIAAQKKSIKIMSIATFSSYFLMYASYRLGYEAIYPYISAIGFDICTLSLVILCLIGFSLVAKNNRDG